jgi:hypothetical protein
MGAAAMSGSTFARRQLEEALAFADVVNLGEVTDDEDAEDLAYAINDLSLLVVDAKLRVDKLRAWLAAPSVFADPKVDPLAGGSA